MPQWQANVSLGREVELYNRVNNNDPTNSAFILLVLAESGLEQPSVLKTKDTVADVLAGTTNEVTNVGYGRKTLTDVDLAAYTVDDTTNSITIAIPVQTFAIISAGDIWAQMLIAYDNDTTAGTDANLVPVSAHDLIVNGSYAVPNGDDIIVDLSAGFIRAS
jgi:hypothetical protein